MGYIEGGPTRRLPRRRAFTLMEVIVVMTIMGVLTALPMPIFSRAIERSRHDIAASNLQAIWNAQRFYRLEHGKFADHLAQLAAEPDRLIDPSLALDSLAEASVDRFYRYEVTLTADGQFRATATYRDEKPSCSGTITIDGSGKLISDVKFHDEYLIPREEAGL